MREETLILAEEYKDSSTKILVECKNSGSWSVTEKKLEKLLHRIIEKAMGIEKGKHTKEVTESQ